MLIHSINTGSSGNCYALEIDGSYLLLDCGVPYMEIARTLNFQVSKIVGCLLTHEHMDHAKCADELIRRGIKVYTSAGTCTKIKKCIPIKNHVSFTLKDFTIMPFDVPHDAEEPFGFYIEHPSIGSLAFITDAMYCKYKFPGVKHLMVEANYSEKLMGNDPEFLKDRIKHSHMSIETCCKFIKINANNLETITLLHMSDRNSDEKEFQKQIRQVSGCRVYLAGKNKKINLLT